MSQHNFIRVVLIALINAAILKPAYLIGVDAHIQNLVGNQSYGLYKALFDLAFLFQFLHEPGIQTFNSKNIAQNPEKLGFHFPRILGLKVVLYVLFVIVVTAAFYLLSYEWDNWPLLLILATNLFLSTLFLYFRANIAAIGKYRLDSWLSSLDKFVMLVILGIWSWVPAFAKGFDLYDLAIGQLVSYVIACGVVLLFHYRVLQRFSIVFSFSYWAQLLKASAPYAFILLSMAAYTRMDGVMLERLLPDQGLQAGIYAANFRILDALNMVGYLFAALLLPMYAANIKNHKAIEDLLQIGLKLMVPISFIGAGFVIFFAKDFLPLIYDDYTPYYSEILTLLMVNFIAISIAYLFGTYLVANGNLFKINVIFAVGVLINFTLNWWLIPKDQALGAATATAITQILMLLGQVVLTIKVLKLKFDAVLFSKIVVFGVICASSLGGVKGYLAVPWYLAASLSILLCLFASFLIGLWDKDMLSELLKKKLS